VKVRQLPLEALEIAEGEAKTRHLAQVVSRGDLYLPRFEKLATILRRPEDRSLPSNGQEAARGKRDQPITSLPTKRMNGFGPSAPNEITV
jgi:hypothetical protein